MSLHLEDGVLTLQIIEGRYGKITAQGAFSEQTQRYLAPLVPGAVIESSTLERTTLLLADLPGIKIAPLMRPGDEIGTGDLVVEVSRDEFFNMRAC
jgi:hemolysin activation/secretion protein